MKAIGIISLKGGVGKTSSVISLGAAFSHFGKKVLLVDANFSAPNLGTHLNIIEPEKTIHNVLGEDHNILEAIQKLENFDVLPAHVFPKVRINPLKLKDKIKILKGKYDIILIDSSPALNEETLSAILASDELIVVSTPDYSTLSMTLKASKLAQKKGTPIKGIILNKVHNKKFEVSLEDIEKTSDIPIMAVVPHDINVLKSQANFIPSVNFKPNSEGSIEYLKLAATLIGEKYKPKKFKNLFERIKPKKQEINRDLFYEGVFR